MALANKCDRCGALYEHYPIGDQPGNWNGLKRVRIDDRGSSIVESKPIDLCPQCMDEFNQYFRGGMEAKK